MYYKNNTTNIICNFIMHASQCAKSLKHTQVSCLGVLQYMYHITLYHVVTINEQWHSFTTCPFGLSDVMKSRRPDVRQNWQSFSSISIVSLCQGVNGELDVPTLFKNLTPAQRKLETDNAPFIGTTTKQRKWPQVWN